MFVSMKFCMSCIDAIQIGEYSAFSSGFGVYVDSRHLV